METTATAPVEVIFADPETVTVAQLRPGDFVVEVPTQMQVRGVRVMSGVKEVMEGYEHPEYGVWTESRGYRRHRVTVLSRVLTFQSVKGSLHYPSDFQVIVRRQVI